MSLTAEQIEKSRAEALAFFKAKFPSINAYADQGGVHLIEERAYFVVGWLARQETLCVELPAMNCDHDDGFHTYDARPVQVAIEAAGIAQK